MCAAGKALCDASQLAPPTSDSLARQGGDSDPHASCTPPPACSRNMPSESAVRNSSGGPFGCSSVLREHLRTITLGLSGELEREHTQYSSEQLLTRARLSPAPVQSQGRLLCSPRDGLRSITFNIPPTSVTRHQLDTRDSVHSAARTAGAASDGENQQGPTHAVWGHTHALDCAGTDGFY